jgi:hypothetical protein
MVIGWTVIYKCECYVGPKITCSWKGGKISCQGVKVANAGSLELVTKLIFMRSL